MLIIASLFCGFLFGLGLLISGMTQPSKVLGFLDVLGAWDPSLGVVMAAALVVSAPGYALAQRRTKPLFATRFDLPTRTTLDAPLLMGSILFGIGWGLAGLCPGPAIENLATLSPQVLVFCAAMLAGMLGYDFGYAPALMRSEAAPLSSDG